MAQSDLPGATGGSVALFSEVFYHIIESADLPAERAIELGRILQEHGAVEHSHPSRHGKVPLEGLTHIITTTVDFEGYEEANDLFKAIVTPGWVEMSIMKHKLVNPRQHSPNPAQFYSGLIVCVADLPEGDKDAIIGGVLAMGGLYAPSISKYVTHIVALTMDPPACKLALERGLDCKIVLPHWFDDCLRLGKRIDEAPYTLPNPELTDKGATDGIPHVARPDLLTCLSDRGGDLAAALGLSEQRGALDVFKNRKVILSQDLDINEHLRKRIEEVIRDGHGEIVEEVKTADILICQWREGSDYRTASTAGKSVGNLAWLYHLIVHNTWTSPLKRLLHYPLVRGGLPMFKDYSISLSNYNGEARIYLENLAKAAGSEFTKTMKMDTTHLITAHLGSEKCEAAKEWNIDIVNHLWLEDSYAKWQVQSVANPRYTHFPKRTNLGEVVGQTQIDKQALERHFYSKGEKSSTSGNRSPVRLDQTPNRPLKSQAAKAVNVAIRTPAASRLADGKENETPSTRGSRSAKEKATAKLHGLADDIALYQKEMKRVGGVTHGRARGSSMDAPDVSRKRSMSNEDGAGSEAEQDAKKRAKKEPIHMRLLITGMEPKKVDQMRVCKRYQQHR